MFEDVTPFVLAGELYAATPTSEVLDVFDKFDHTPFARVRRATADELDLAVERAFAARQTVAAVPAWRRQAALNRIAETLRERAEVFAQVLCAEAGKPIRDARAEVSRAIDTFRLGAEESTRIGGEYMPLDATPRAEGYTSLTRRVPVGVAALITPFNFPLNLVAHKVAPALAAGCPFILKPASTTPVSALLLGQILMECDLPPGTFSVLPCSGATAERLVTDDRVSLVSFTGSPEVGWRLKALSGRKRVSLELGGNAGCIVDADADLDQVVPRVTFGAFTQSGQSCISVQRVLVHRSLYPDFVSRLKQAAEALVAGDPRDLDTVLGPLITEADAQRVEALVEAARERGATVDCGGVRDGCFYAATVLTDVPHDADVSAREVFGPVVTVEPFDDFAAAVAVINDSRFGLQAGVFTRDLHHAYYAWEHLEVGGVIIGDVPTFRVDGMPYGGVKASGLGREGVRFAIEEMTECRLMVLRRAGELPR